MFEPPPCKKETLLLFFFCMAGTTSISTSGQRSMGHEGETHAIEILGIEPIA
jgi:hypothetical protein